MSWSYNLIDIGSEYKTGFRPETKAVSESLKAFQQK